MDDDNYQIGYSNGYDSGWEGGQEDGEHRGRNSGRVNLAEDLLSQLPDDLSTLKRTEAVALLEKLKAALQAVDYEY